MLSFYPFAYFFVEQSYKKRFQGKALFIYDVHEEMGKGNHQILGNFAEVCGWCFGKDGTLPFKNFIVVNW